MEATTKTAVTFTTRERSDILTTAVCGGINYWSIRGSAITINARAYGLTQGDVHAINAYDCDGGGGTLSVNDSRLDLAAAKVLDTLPGTATAIYLRNAIAENDIGHIDAEAADVLVQMALFGDVVYG